MRSENFSGSRAPRRSPRFNSGIHIMGVLNVTPDSFSDGGEFFDADSAITRGRQMAAEGADIIDIGGESTRPGADDVDIAEELRRVVPVIEELSSTLAVPLSIDTRKSEVAKAALEAGAAIVNDVSGLRCDPKMSEVIAEAGAAVIIMHMKGTPRNMQDNPAYTDVMAEISDYLIESVRIAKRAGIAEEDIIIDPGIGFGKTVGHNIEILNRLAELKTLGFPICVGTSRKSFLGGILGSRDPRGRLAGTIAASVIAASRGANILRVHDVRELKEAALVTERILQG